ncbi:MULTISPECIES: SDR family oxidoreductase [unclassified Comamonas]|uniref:SDR family oxidoreductase n=1 Tax=unclassified Comamonas TaxID=2638500 RepID=UPI001FA70CF3|nr:MULTISPECIES: SDR family oxidoreductase [unclassified Comamonas]UNV88720.1 SDR family oxidoreductase [Comamonas sp. 7D-2evo1]UNV93375.1 SDR family oxidoreductase [Comamonas sp. 7D-2]UNV98363.1 SDR family oxidoreductase [Comamonas sp. 7D-2evo2]
MSQHRILVTGASRGIGLEIARHFSEKGHEVVGVARSKPESFPGGFYEVDLSSAKDTQACLADISKDFDADIVINNAGLTTSNTIEESDFEEFDSIVAVNLRAAMQCAQAFIPSMKKRQWGRIVNVSSRAALGMPKRNAYSAAKAGIIGFTRSWALDLGKYGITVNAVAPGPIQTELYKKNNPMTGDQMSELIRRIPVNRLGTPEDIISPIDFFCDEKSGYVTGQVLYVCGGLSIGAAPV